MSNDAFVNKVGRADWIVVLDQVRKNLPSTFSVAKQMHLTPPLQIDADVKDKDASGYKVPYCFRRFQSFLGANTAAISKVFFGSASSP